MLNVPRERREKIVEILMEYGVTYSFAGHWHKNAYAEYGPLNIVASGAVGYPPRYRPVRTSDRQGLPRPRRAPILRPRRHTGNGCLVAAPI